MQYKNVSGEDEEQVWRLSMASDSGFMLIRQEPSPPGSLWLKDAKINITLSSRGWRDLNPCLDVQDFHPYQLVTPAYGYIHWNYMLGIYTHRFCFTVHKPDGTWCHISFGAVMISNDVSTDFAERCVLPLLQQGCARVSQTLSFGCTTRAMCTPTILGGGFLLGILW